MTTPPDKQRRVKKLPLSAVYECSRCDRLFPSPEAGNAHLDKKHNGHGFLTWHPEDKRLTA